MSRPKAAGVQTQGRRPYEVPNAAVAPRSTSDARLNQPKPRRPTRSATIG